MPILNTSVEKINTDVVTPDRKLYTNPDFKTSTLFNEDHELNNIIQYVSGNKWTVNYFQQIREINTPAIMPDVSVATSVLSYNRISGLVIILSTAIDQTDPNSIVGSASINSGFLPNYGDAFIATLTGGREAVFVVTLVEKKLYSLHDMYTVEFKLFSFLDKESEFYRDLISKVIKEYTYDKSYIQDKSAPIILSQDYKNKLNYKTEKQSIIDYYFNNHVNSEKNVVALPMGDNVTSIYVDTLLNEFLLKIVGYTGYPNSDKLNRFELPNITSYSIYDMIINREIEKLPFLEKDFIFSYIRIDSGEPVMRHLSWLGINYTIDKLRDDMKVDYSLDIKVNTVTKPVGFEEPIKIKDSNYIFSEAFYTQDIDNCGMFEKALLQYLRNEVIDSGVMANLLANYRYWDTIDQYYLLPILIVLIQDNINNSYSQI